jgi:elongation factor Ts
MTNIQLIQELRTLTAAGMKDCKDALTQSGWDLNAAVDLIKAKGLNIVSGREGKIASEGTLALEAGQHTAVLVEVNSQTDFTAKLPAFQELSSKAAKNYYQSLMNKDTFDPNHQELKDLRENLISQTKENIVIRRWWKQEALSPQERVFTYLHSNKQIGVLLLLQANEAKFLDDERFVKLGEDLSMQIAAMNPIAVSANRLSNEQVLRQRSIFETQVKEEGKPEAMWDKIIAGKMNRWQKETCLLEQDSVLVPKSSVGKVVIDTAKDIGCSIGVVDFVRAQVGSDIEKVSENFANEVAKLV